MENAPFGMFGTFEAVPGKRDELASILRDAARALEGAEGVRAYVVYVPNDRPDQVGVFEVWDDRAAHDASLQLPAVRELITRARPLLAGPPSSQEVVPLGGIGLAG